MKLWKFLLLLVSLGVFAGIAVIGINFLVLPSIIHSNKVVLMPDIRGMTAQGAGTVLTSFSLEVEVSRQMPHPTIPEGMILDQIPGPETQIRGGRTVKVITSSGPPEGAVPRLTGLSPRQAEITLQRENFRLGRVLRIRKAGVTDPEVEYQNPGAGIKMYKGAVVDLVVSEPAASQLIRMPDLRGVALYQARQIIDNAGFVLAPVSYERKKDMPPNLVVDQKPQAGKRIREGERLELVASSR